MSNSTDARTVTMLQEAVAAYKREITDLKGRLAAFESPPLPQHTVELWFNVTSGEGPQSWGTLVVVDGQVAECPLVTDPPPAIAAQYTAARVSPQGYRIPWVGPVETAPPPTLGQAMLQVRADGRITTLTVPVRCLVRPDLNPPELYICLTPDELISLIELADGHPWEIGWQHPLKITPEDGS